MNRHREVEVAENARIQERIAHVHRCLGITKTEQRTDEHVFVVVALFRRSSMVGVKGGDHALSALL